MYRKFNKKQELCTWISLIEWKGVKMFCKLINSGKLRLQWPVINCLLIISYLTTFSSCTTTEMSYVSPNSLKSGSLGEITKIELKNGTIIYCKDKLIKIDKQSDTTAFFVITTADTVKTGNNNRFSIRMNEERIPEKDVKKIHLEKDKINGLNTALLVAGIAAGAFVAYIIVVAVASSNDHLK